MIHKTFIFAATKDVKEKSLLFKSLDDHNLLENSYFQENNTESLSILYNRAIDFAIENDVEYLVLCHDDVMIESHNWLEKISSLMQVYDVIGVAGTSKANIKKPALWHIMGKDNELSTNHGAVSHPYNDSWMTTSFGPYPARVILLDGVFLAIKRDVFKRVRFDEENPTKFHFYDLNFSLQCNKEGFKLGVGDILIRHVSPGLKTLEDKEWIKGQKWFLNKWKNKK